MVGEAVADPLGELLQRLLIERVGSLEDRGFAAALLRAVDDEHLMIGLVCKPGSRVRVGGILPTEDGSRHGRVDAADLIELAAGTVKHGGVDVGLALYDERQLSILVGMDVHLGALDVVAALALHHDIVVVLADHGGVHSIDDCLGDGLVEVAHRCPHLAACVGLCQVLCMEGGDGLAVDAKGVGQIEAGSGRHVWFVVGGIVQGLGVRRQAPNTRSAMALVLASERHQRTGSPEGGHIQIMHSSPQICARRKAWLMSVAQSQPH